jgi:hypothetical protein
MRGEKRTKYAVSSGKREEEVKVSCEKRQGKENRYLGERKCKISTGIMGETGGRCTLYMYCTGFMREERK